MGPFFLDPFFWTNFWIILSGGGRPLLPREGWDTLYQYSRRGGKQTVVLFFCHANEKLTPKHPTITVVENITNSLFRSSAVESCVSPLSRLVLVLNDTHELSRIIHKLFQLSFCVYSISLLNLSFFLLSFILSRQQRFRSFRSLALNLAAYYSQALQQF